MPPGSVPFNGPGRKQSDPRSTHEHGVSKCGSEHGQTLMKPRDSEGARAWPGDRTIAPAFNS